jgi:hypothetical protein
VLRRYVYPRSISFVSVRGGAGRAKRLRRAAEPAVRDEDALGNCRSGFMPRCGVREFEVAA